MPAIVLAAVNATPDIFVIDLVAVFRRHFNSSAVHRVVFQGFFAFATPKLKACPMGVVVDVRNHVIRQMAVLMCHCVDQSILAVDDALCKLNRSMLLDQR